MRVLQKLYLIFLGLLICLYGCDNKPNSEQTKTLKEEVLTPPETVEPTNIPKDKVFEILSNYYEDLSRSQVDESKYFAVELEQFFSSQNLAREKVGQSIRNGFTSFESREVSMDANSLKVTENGSNYIAEFSGKSQFVRKGESTQQKQTFTNRVTFNSDFEIIRYEAADAPRRPATERKVGRRVDSRMEVAKRIIDAFGKGEYESVSSYIHPKLGYVFLTQPGAMSVPYQCKSLSELVNYAPWFEDGFKDLEGAISAESIPNFNCGDMFSKEGIFLDKASNYDQVSKLMGYLNDAEMGKYEAPQINEIKNVEKYISAQIIATKSGVGFYLGEIDGKWYLLVVDIATYDCSA